MAGLSSSTAGAPTRRSTKRRVALTVAVVVSVAVIGLVVATIVMALRLRAFNTRAYFRDHRADLDRVVRLVDDGRLVATERERYYYGPKLPEDLRYLSDTERVSIYDDGSLFIPLWTGIPDDAGGYWHSERSPEGNNMYGLACHRPVRLAPDWWACGMRGVRFPAGPWW